MVWLLFVMCLDFSCVFEGHSTNKVSTARTISPVMVQWLAVNIHMQRTRTASSLIYNLLLQNSIWSNRILDVM